jgi:ABC-type bacteriocin/lantibiotic exporter with double-glycine peptidase domain
MAALAQAAVLGLGGQRVMQGLLTVGDLMAFQSLAASFLGPVGAIIALAQKLPALQGSLSRVDDVLHHPARDSRPTAGAPPAVHTTRRFEGFIELREVCFGYDRSRRPLIENLSFAVEPGQYVALVGRSGCGKSTIARLLAGLHEPWSGQILFDGKPRDAWPRHELTASLALVEQDIVLFEGSLRDNLALWDVCARDAVLRRAMEDAGVPEGLLGGLDGRLNEAGRNLSGGQRQRVELARALAGDPRVLVLDEATSALDAVAEEQVMRAIRRRGLSVISIAHRLTSVRHADQILVLEEGRLMQRGTHDALMGLGTHDGQGMYRELMTQGSTS